MMGELEILQVNLNKSRTAHDLLEETARDLQIDLCLLSEPNIARTRRKNSTGWIADEKADVLLWWTGHSNALSICKQGRGDGYAWATVEDKVTVYSCYFSPNRTIEKYEVFLDNLG